MRIDRPSPRVRDAALWVCRGAQSDRERALRLFGFVRDRIRFGFTSRFDQATPEETLDAELGHCNPQATLLASMLRSVGLAARQHFVRIPNDILHGVFSISPARWLDHSFVEVHVDGRWIQLDGYILDPPLYRGALSRLRREGRRMGWGAHIDGRIEWDGRSDCMAQLASDDMVPSGGDLGAFDDPSEHYESDRYGQRLSWIGRLAFQALAVPEANARLDGVRAEG